jgi:glycosyltransferase involved in cell wall biosynthesis
MIDPLSGPLSVWWYRHWHGRFLELALRPELGREAGHVVVYAQCPVSAAAAIAARRSKDQRVVMAVHFNVSQADEWVDKGKLSRGDRVYRHIKSFEDRVLPQLDGIVYVSEFMRGELEERFPQLRAVASSVIPNFIELPPARGGAPQSGDLVNVGTLEPRKNQAYLIEILAAAGRMGRRYSLSLIGDGPDKHRLEQLASRAGVHDQLRFLGFRADAARIVGEHRLYCHTARMENFGLAILEAMAQGVPVVATPVGGTMEVFDDGVEGTFWPLDDAEGAARRLVELMDDPARLAAMGAAGRIRVANRFTCEIAGRRLYEFCADVGDLDREGEAKPESGGRDSLSGERAEEAGLTPGS